MSTPVRLRDGVLDQIAKRLVVDCFLEASATYWLKRASDFERTLPRSGDFPGRRAYESTPEVEKRIAEIVTACRNAAVVARSDEERARWETLFDEILGAA